MFSILLPYFHILLCLKKIIYVIDSFNENAVSLRNILLFFLSLFFDRLVLFTKLLDIWKGFLSNSSDIFALYYSASERKWMLVIDRYFDNEFIFELKDDPIEEE